MVVRRYRDLVAWQLGYRFKRQVFRLILGSPGAKTDLRFRTQMLESARSVPRNIAEGFLRRSPGDFARFLDYSLGSIGETEEGLGDGIELSYFTAEMCAEAYQLGRRCLTATVRLKQSQIRYMSAQRASRERGKRKKSDDR